jgi:hypothetical protein
VPGRRARRLKGRQTKTTRPVRPEVPGATDHVLDLDAAVPASRRPAAKTSAEIAHLFAPLQADHMAWIEHIDMILHEMDSTHGPTRPRTSPDLPAILPTI